MELIYYLIFLDRDKMDVYWDKTRSSRFFQEALGTWYL